MKLGIKFNCVSCGEPYILPKVWVEQTIEDGCGVLPYCNMCVPPEDYVEIEDVETEEVGMSDDEWEILKEKQRRK